MHRISVLGCGGSACGSKWRVNISFQQTVETFPRPRSKTISFWCVRSKVRKVFAIYPEGPEGGVWGSRRLYRTLNSRQFGLKLELNRRSPKVRFQDRQSNRISLSQGQCVREQAAIPDAILQIPQVFAGVCGNLEILFDLSAFGVCGRRRLYRTLNSRQFGLKLIANVTYGYTGLSAPPPSPSQPTRARQSVICIAANPPVSWQPNLLCYRSLAPSPWPRLHRSATPVFAPPPRARPRSPVSSNPPVSSLAANAPLSLQPMHHPMVASGARGRMAGGDWVWCRAARAHA